MTLSDLQTLIGSLTNDPNHERYKTSSPDDIGTELDNEMDRWNVEAKIIKDTVSITLTSGTRRYALSNLTGTVIGFNRVTHNGLPLKKVDKTYLDLYSGTDWTQVSGTPTRYLIEQTDPDLQYFVTYPTPGGDDAVYPAVVEYIKRHTSMSASSDVPFLSVASSNSILRPYDWGLAYCVASRLLKRDPSAVNVPKSLEYEKIGNGVLLNVVQVFKDIEKEEPLRLKGGRSWGRL